MVNVSHCQLDLIAHAANALNELPERECEQADAEKCPREHSLIL